MSSSLLSMFDESLSHLDEGFLNFGSSLLSAWNNLVGQEQENDVPQMFESSNQRREATKSSSSSNRRKNAVAAFKLNKRIQDLELVAGIAADEYVSDFMVAYQDLKQIDGHAMDEDWAKFLFLTKIRDPDFEGLRHKLRMEIYQKSLSEMARDVLISESARREKKRSLPSTSQTWVIHSPRKRQRRY